MTSCVKSLVRLQKVEKSSTFTILYMMNLTIALVVTRYNLVFAMSHVTLHDKAKKVNDIVN